MQSSNSNRSTTSPELVRHVHKHHRRAWYKRWWRTLNAHERATKVILIAALIAAALLIGYIGSQSDTILPTRPRRMVTNETARSWSLDSNVLPLETRL